MVSTMKIVDTKKAALRSGSTDGVRVNRTGRRTYTLEYKRGVVRQCGEPGVSVAGVALAHGINANLVRRWMVSQGRTLAGPMAESRAVLLPVSVQRVAPAHETRGDEGVSAATKQRRAGTAAIEIELYGARIHLRGCVDAQALHVVLVVLSRRLTRTVRGNSGVDCSGRDRYAQRHGRSGGVCANGAGRAPLLR